MRAREPAVRKGQKQCVGRRRSETGQESAAARGESRALRRERDRGWDGRGTLPAPGNGGEHKARRTINHILY